MTLLVKLARTALPSLVVALAIGGCEGADPTEPIGTAESIVAIKSVPVAPAFASAFRGGIPFGMFHLPQEEYGATFNGSLANISPSLLIGYLETARRTGAKVILTLSGNQENFKNSDGSFSLTKWKERVNRYRGLNLTSFIDDGTIVGHYLIDEPHDPDNWGGKPMPLSAVEAMGEYSKELWPSLPTVARAWPSYLKSYKFKYLDAAWAQYSERKGPIGAFIQENVRDAKAAGLALVVGLNQMAGGSSKGIKGYYDGKYAMAADELESWGSALLAEPYACAFISWQYNAKYLARSDVQSAMAALSAKARNRSSRSCNANGQSVEPTAPVIEPVPPVTPDPVVPADSVVAPDPVVTPDPIVAEPPPPATPVTPPVPPVTPPVPPVVTDSVRTNPPPAAPAAIKLSVTGDSKSGKHYMRLTWSGASGSMVHVYRDGLLRKQTENDKKYTNSRSFRGAATYAYKVCERGTTRCSASVRVTVR